MIDESAPQPNPEEKQILENHPKNMKNTIIKKLTSMMGISRQNLQEVEEQANLQNPNTDDKRTKRHSSYCLNDDKLQKNRESARKARIRKKLYVKLLEQQVAKMKDIAAQGKLVEKQMQSYLTKFKAHISEKKDLFQLKSVLYNNMHNVSICMHNISDDNIKPLLASYQTKLGPASAERINSLDRQVSQIQQGFVPRHVQLLFESDPNEIASLQQSSDNNPIKAGQIMIKLQAEQAKLIALFASLRDNVDQAKSQLRILNRILQQMKTQCTSMEICKLLLFIENQSNKTDIVKQFIKHLQFIDMNRIKKNDEELYDYIFKNELRKTIFVDLNETEDLMRKVTVFLEKPIG